VHVLNHFADLHQLVPALHVWWHEIAPEPNCTRCLATTGEVNRINYLKKWLMAAQIVQGTDSLCRTNNLTYFPVPADGWCLFRSVWMALDHFKLLPEIDSVTILIRSALQ
jgi:hypothetical protein